MTEVRVRGCEAQPLEPVEHHLCGDRGSICKRSKPPREMFYGSADPSVHRLTAAYGTGRGTAGSAWSSGREIHLFQVSRDEEGLPVDAGNAPGTGRSPSPSSFQGAESRAWAAVSRPAQASCHSWFSRALRAGDNWPLAFLLGI